MFSYNQLKKYQLLNKGLIKNKRKSNQKSLGKTLKVSSAILPVVSILTLQDAIAQQCFETTNVAFNGTISAGNNNIDIDVDGGGNDIRIFVAGTGLFIRGINATLKFLRTNGAFPDGSANAIRFSNGAAIPGAFTQSVQTLYMHYGAASGQWPANGATTGFAGFKKGSNFGFVRITVNETSGNVFSVTVDARGTSSTTDPITAGDCSTLLPVELTHFSASPNEDHVHLNWATASEINNAGFEIERSDDGVHYQSLAWVEGAGTSNVPQEYSFKDSNARVGKNYFYRLKQIDFDGQFEYSKIIQVQLDRKEEWISDFYPNPSSSETTNIDIHAENSGSWNISVFNSLGQELSNEKRTLYKGINALALDFSNLNNGQYYVKFEKDHQRIYRSLTIRN